MSIQNFEKFKRQFNKYESIIKDLFAGAYAGREKSAIRKIKRFQKIFISQHIMRDGDFDIEKILKEKRDGNKKD